MNSQKQGRHPANSCEKSKIVWYLLEFTGIFLNSRMDGRTDRWTDGWTDGRTDKGIKPFKELIFAAKNKVVYTSVVSLVLLYLPAIDVEWPASWKSTKNKNNISRQPKPCHLSGSDFKKVGP